MKRKILSFMLAFVCIITCGLCLSACGNKDIEPISQRISINLTDKVAVEYEKINIYNDTAIFVKDGNEYYIKAKNIHGTDREEIFMKRDLSNIVFEDEYGGWYFISARYDNQWISASEDGIYAPKIANDKNQNAYTNAEYALRTGYSDINHVYENGVADRDGHKYTATQKENETLTIGGKQIECVVWEYEEYHSEDNWKKEKFWFEAETKIVLKQTFISSLTENQSLDADENVQLLAKYFSKTDTMQNYLTSIERYPAPDFSSYN